MLMFGEVVLLQGVLVMDLAMELEEKYVYVEQPGALLSMCEYIELMRCWWTI